MLNCNVAETTNNLTFYGENNLGRTRYKVHAPYILLNRSPNGIIFSKCFLKSQNPIFVLILLAVEPELQGDFKKGSSNDPHMTLKHDRSKVAPCIKHLSQVTHLFLCFTLSFCLFHSHFRVGCSVNFQPIHFF